MITVLHQIIQQQTHAVNILNYPKLELQKESLPVQGDAFLLNPHNNIQKNVKFSSDYSYSNNHQIKNLQTHFGLRKKFPKTGIATGATTDKKKIYPEIKTDQLNKADPFQVRFNNDRNLLNTLS